MKRNLRIKYGFALALWRCQPTVCVTCVWAGVDNVWEQRKLEARKMLENAAESHTSGARFVGWRGLEDPFDRGTVTLTLYYQIEFPLNHLLILFLEVLPP